MNTDYQKITQALNLLAQKCGRGTLNRMKAIKLLYLADRYHLRKYGRPLANDNYYAMERGVVGSVAKDITYDSDFLDDEARLYARKFIQPVGEHEYQSAADVDQKVFSETDLEALTFTISHFGSFDQWSLVDITHVFPEWKKYEQIVKEPGSSVPIKYEDFFEDPLTSDPVFKKYFPDGDVFKYVTAEGAKEVFREWNEQTKLWK